MGVKSNEVLPQSVRGNFIGTDVTGTAGITPNDVQGIVDKGNSNRIGGTTDTTPGGACTGHCTLISGNNINGGIVIDPAAIGSIVQGNFVGTDVTGNLSISNGLSEGFSEGILSYAVGATIGGTIPEARNVVSDNKGTGIPCAASPPSCRATTSAPTLPARPQYPTAAPVSPAHPGRQRQPCTAHHRRYQSAARHLLRAVRGRDLIGLGGRR